MDTQAVNRAPRDWPRRVAWLPIPLLLLALGGLWVFDLHGAAFESPRALIALNFVFSTLVSLFVAYLVGRSFVARGAPGLLLLGCGVVVWGLAGLVGTVAADDDANIQITVHNTGTCLSAACHLVGVLLALRARRPMRKTGVWLVGGYALVLAALGVIALAARASWLPVFFIQGQGGTPLRQLVLGAAVVMFAGTAVLLGVTSRRPLSAFSYWYSPALSLLAVGLFGVLIQASHGSLLGWTGRGAQYLAGVYMVIAAIAAARETGVRGITLDAGVWNDRLLRFLTPQYLRSLSPIWRYGLVVVIVVAATFLRRALLPWLGPTVPYNIAFLAVAGTTALLGIGPGLLCVLLGDIAVEMFVLEPPATVLNVTLLARLGVSLLIGAFLAWFLHAIRIAQTRTRESEERFKVLTAASFEGVAITEAGRITDANEQLLDMLGYSRAELIGINAADLLLPEDQPRIMDNIMSGREAFTEHVMTRKDGSHITVEAHGRTIVHQNRQVRLTAIRDITEHKRMETALELAARKYATIVDTTSDGVWIHNLQGRILEVNDAYCRMSGYDRDELLGAPLSKLEAVESQEEIAAHIKKLLDAGGHDRFESRHRRKDGAIFDADITALYLDIEGGRIAVFVRDITARKRAEEAVRRSEARLAQIIEMAPAFMCVLRGPRFVFELVNEDYYQVVGRRELIGKPLLEALPELAGQPYPAILEQVFQTGEPFQSGEVCVRLLPPGGAAFEERWLEFVYLPLRGADGLVNGVFVHGVDLTERKRAEEAVRVSELRLRRFYESPLLGVLFWNMDGAITDANDEFLKMVGYDREDLAAGRVNWLRMTPEEYRPQDARVVAELKATGMSQGPVEKEYVRKDGRRIPVIMAGAVLDGEHHNGVAFVLDITERKRLEQQRDALLRSERAARGEAEHANRMKDEFIATLSHELRNPLNAILGWAQLLKRPRRSVEDVQEGVAIIEDSARSLSDMISDLLDISRITSGKLRLDVQSVDLHAVIAAAVEAVKPAIEAKEIQLKTDLDPAAGPVRGDPNRLRQVVWNLLSNAAKFTDRGGRVEVALRRVNSQAEIIVTDTGRGIAPDFLPHVFERFRQADTSAARKHGGLGLGLSIVRHLVELHGGTVTAASPGIDQGATFTVHLPLATVVPVDKSPARPAAVGTALTTIEFENVTLDGLRVLAVDDENESLELVRRVLEERRAHVFTAACATEAVALLQRVQPDVVVSDLGMPGEDGFWFMRQVRALEAACGGATPAVALTAFAGSEHQQRAILAGYQAYLTKPIEVAQLVATVAGLAGRISYVSPAQNGG